jgi:hypothetical protein
MAHKNRRAVYPEGVTSDSPAVAALAATLGIDDKTNVNPNGVVADREQDRFQQPCRNPVGVEI